MTSSGGRDLAPELASLTGNGQVAAALLGAELSDEPVRGEGDPAELTSPLPVATDRDVDGEDLASAGDGDQGGAASSADERAARTAAAALFGESLEGIDRYVDILASRGIAWGLLGPREPARLWSRHILNCVVMAPLIPEGARVADVGSGAGLPGIPLALARPDLRVTLVESLLRRTEFLTQAVEELGLGDRVRVVRARAEEHRERYPVVTARAVASLERLVGWCGPLLEPRGVLLALKGETAEDEVLAARSQLRRQRMTAEVVTVGSTETGRTHVVRVRRVG